MDNPWLSLPDEAPYVLPVDAAAVEHYQERATDRHRFNLEMVPEPYMGDPFAPVVVLTGNPRYRDDDLPTHRRADVRRLLLASARQETLSHPLVWLDPQLDNTSGWAWYRSRLGALCNVVGLELVARGVVFYESLPYHSKELKSLSRPVPSQRYTNSLAEEAIASDRLIIWQRGDWRRLLRKDVAQIPGVVRPRSLQSSYLTPGNLTPAVFDRVVDAVRS